jgi:hypothetical protein
MAITVVHADGVNLRTVHLGLTLATVAAAGMVAVGGAMGTQTAGHLHVAWLSIAFGLHAVANGLPTLGPRTLNGAPLLVGILSAGSLAVAVLLMLWTTHFPASGASVHWGIAAVVCGAAVVFAVADVHVPAGSVLLDLSVIQLAVAFGWTGAAVRALATGLGRRDVPVARCAGVRRVVPPACRDRPGRTGAPAQRPAAGRHGCCSRRCRRPAPR